MHLPRLADRLRRRRAGHAHRKSSQRLQGSPAPGRLSDARGRWHGVDIYGSARDATGVSSLSMEHGARRPRLFGQDPPGEQLRPGSGGRAGPHPRPVSASADQRLAPEPAQRRARRSGRHGAGPLHARHVVWVSVGGHPRPRRSVAAVRAGDSVHDAVVDDRALPGARGRLGRGTHAHAWVPLDDEHCWVYYIHFDPYAPIDRSVIDGLFNWSSLLGPVTSSARTRPTCMCRTVR